jgi:hypothetical protein
MVLRDPLLAEAARALAQGEVAARDQGAHPEFLGECERVMKALAGVLHRIAAAGGLASEAERPGLAVHLVALAREVEHPRGCGTGAVQARCASRPASFLLDSSTDPPGPDRSKRPRSISL